ncbi:hypothetical protein BJV82DRAFT_321094 [Fennellomyces sp. T-0311]|nr:hypothetical protein BJV82DRAFT_321094 [Fennellomyces sp. T-0311]
MTATAPPFIIDFELWAPLSISDSFSEDLIRQFDLKRSILLDQEKHQDFEKCQDDNYGDNDADSNKTAERDVPDKHPFLNAPPPAIVGASTVGAEGRSSTLNRSLLRKSSEFFRHRIMKIKTKESPVSSTVTTDSSVEPVVLHYPPKPLHYSPEVHPPAEEDAKRRSLPLPAKYKRSSSRPLSHQPDKRKSLILRNFLK